MTNPNTFLGTDKDRGAHSGRNHGSAVHLANFTPEPAVRPFQTQREKLLEQQWSENAEERARHMFEPKLREYVHEASLAHRGAVISLTFMPSNSVEDDEEGLLLSCGVDGKMRGWDAATGALASGAALDVECWSKAVPIQLSVAGPPEDVCFLPEKENVSIRCLRTGELLCGLSAHTQEVQCVTLLPGRGELFTGGNDGRLLKWRLQASEMPDDNMVCLD
jgi:WD40 repeat protein